MQLGRCCRCELKRLVTIKGIDTVDGVTIWEYGPGTMWRDNYGMDQITGIECNTGATLNRYIVSSGGHVGVVSTMIDRSVSTLAANAMEPLTLTVLNSLSGTIISSGVTIEGFFCTAVQQFGFLPSLPSFVRAAAGLSGGNYLIIGDEYPPQLELVDFASNTADKEYIFHAHGLQAGVVTLTTRTSNETVTLAYNVSAAAMETTLEATADVVSATCTGGPWPLRKINCDITWSAAGGDFKSITHDRVYDVDGTDRSTSGTAWTYDPATGLLESSIGYVFGFGTGKTYNRLIVTSGGMPVPAGPAIERAGNYTGSGAGNTAAFISSGTNIEVWTVGAGVGAWTCNFLKIINISGGFPYGPTFTWLRAENNNLTSGFGRAVFTGPSRTLCGYTLDMSTGTVAEIDFPETVGISTTFSDNQVGMFSHDGDEATQTAFGYRETHEVSGRAMFRFHRESGELQCGGNYYHIGCYRPHGADATQFYGQSSHGQPVFNYADPGSSGATISGSSAKSYLWTIYTTLSEHFATGTEFRFRFAGGNVSNPPIYTDWVDWLATTLEIETAVLNAIGENTEGVVSSCTVYLFGLPSYSITNATGYLERGLEIRFAGAVNDTGRFWGFKTGSVYFASRRVTIETRTVTHTAIGGITAWNRTTGNPVWARAFGTSIATSSDVGARMAWVKSDILYAVGGPVENELP